MTESIFTYRGTVYAWECDHMGHMNVIGGMLENSMKQPGNSWHPRGYPPGVSARSKQGTNRYGRVERHIEYKREVLAP